MRIIIFGKRSNLSKHLKENMKNVTLVSSCDIYLINEFFSKFAKEEICLILNHFQPSTRLNDYDEPEEYITNSILLTSKILEFCKFNSHRIKKIIYTSSSSVYGNNQSCSESDSLKPESLHATLKLANEKLISQFSSKYKIPVVIVRIFNMFGGDDKFSVISKIINAINSKKTLKLINSGTAVRDYIHIQDVVSVYKTLIGSSFNGILNIASGRGVSVIELLDLLSQRGIKFKSTSIDQDELSRSIANISKLKQVIDTESFCDVKQHILANINYE